MAFYPTVRAALVKSSAQNISKRDREFAVQQLIDRSVVATDIVDILKAASMQNPDISILSDEFLAEIRDAERPHLALEALKKLLNDRIRARSQAHIVGSRKYSERLADAVARYHASAISALEVIQALIDLAKDMQARILAVNRKGCCLKKSRSIGRWPKTKARWT